jgi:hypothetical protein
VCSSQFATAHHDPRAGNNGPGDLYLQKNTQQHMCLHMLRAACYMLSSTCYLLPATCCNLHSTCDMPEAKNPSSTIKQMIIEQTLVSVQAVVKSDT